MEQKLLLHVISETGLQAGPVANVIEMLFKDESTIPFITRYRKEKTGGMDEVQIQQVKDTADEYFETEKRRDYILKAIEKMEKLTPELKKQIETAPNLKILEDIYAPYKSKKKTKAMIAKEAGLEPLAQLILGYKDSKESLEKLTAEKFLNPEAKITNVDEAIKGASDIIIETFANDIEIKDYLRERYWSSAKLVSEKRKDAESIADWHKYKDYFEFSQEIKTLKEAKNSHRFMAIRRGVSAKVLKVSIDFEEEVATSSIAKKYFDDSGLSFEDFLQKCAGKAYRVYIHPSLDLEIKSEIKKFSDTEAINVFGVNLRNLLLQPYLGAKAVMGIDPGVRTGCKIVVVDSTGKLQFDTVIYPHPPKNDVEHSMGIVKLLVEKFKVEYIAIGNGTYGRETYAFVRDLVKKPYKGKLEVSLISESGASIYSTSEIARSEFPDKDPTVRGAVSIARRFQDPLAELVKIDPKSIGVGQYQHDVNQVRLKKSLGNVIESCVNFVGVDLNTASAPLLSYVSGIGPKVAENIVKFRQDKGHFSNRGQLLKVARFSEKVFEQAAGFLRIYNGEQALDGTFIHPESYKIIEKWSSEQGVQINDLVGNNKAIAKFEADKNLLSELGEFTHKDIVTSLRAPSQDPRTVFEASEFRDDVTKITDLEVNQWYPGIVTNITQFGAFVDIGIKENGLLHISQIADKFVENALNELKVGQKLKVRVMEVDLERKRISLSCKSEDAADGQRRTSDSRPRSGQGGGKPRKPRHDGPQKLRNNAFAALKGFKVK